VRAEGLDGPPSHATYHHGIGWDDETIYSWRGFPDAAYEAGLIELTLYMDWPGDEAAQQKKNISL